MRMSETISKISIDLVKATSEIKNAVKTTSGYGYKYAPPDFAQKHYKKIVKARKEGGLEN